MRKRPGYSAVIGVLALLMAFMAAVMAYGELSTSIRSEEPRIIEVRRGESLRQVTRRLAAEGVLHQPGLLTLLAILRGDSAKIQAGEYVIQGAVSPRELLDYFVSGRARQVSLTIPEGFSIVEIAARLQARELGSAAELLRLAQDRRFIASLGLPLQSDPPTLEGLIYPDTYYFHRGLSEASLLTAMVEQFKKRAGGVLMAQSARLGMRPYEVLILASIIEKETAVGGERPLISAVFHNRLQARMRLASDPTVIYGLEEFDGNLKRVHLRTRTPYNTYKISGLPPTPITNPGLDSITAALAPAKVDYLYFVAKGDGTHYFSRDFRSHRRAVWKYQVRPHRRRKS